MQLTQPRIIAAIAVGVSVVILIMVVSLGGKKHDPERLVMKPCGGVEAKYSQFEISACPHYKEGRCELIAGESITIKLDFETPVAFKEVDTFVEMIAVTEQQDACAKGAKCPSEVGDRQQVVWKANTWREPNEATELKIGLQIKNSDKFAFCYMLPARILPAPPSSDNEMPSQG